MRGRINLRDSSGALAVEFALIAPVFILALIGGFQLAWSLHCAATVRWALETSARNLMLDPTESATTLKANMVSLLNGRATASNLAVTITTDTSSPAGKLLVASSTYSTTLVVPFLSDTPLVFNASTSVPAL
ncbi:MAG: TadE/TadG family type IV pilus assembly protein [Phenylobacterium sp.]